MKGKGSPTYKLNGKIAEKPVLNDFTPPYGYKPCVAPIKLTTNEAIGSEKTSLDLESYNAKISSKEGNISYTFFDQVNNGYFNEITKKSIVGIKIIQDSLSCKVLNYKLTQTVLGKRAPMSIVFLLDHSGSMGDIRANIMQQALDSAINYKRPDDEITIIKFDNFVKSLITSNDKNKLQSF